ncbi:MAG: polyprenyl synthetase family protein [Maricaulaceae bacterium]
MATLSAHIKETADRLTVALDALLPRATGPEGRLASAMRYVALASGQRLRTYFALECGRLFDVDERALLRVAAALECVHAQITLLDALDCLGAKAAGDGPPAGDVFDDATLILAGAALSALAFEILLHPDTHADPRVRDALSARLAAAIGAHGAAGGRLMAHQVTETSQDAGLLTRMQRLRTGELIAFAAQAGAMLARAGEDVFQALAGFAHDFGLAYQISAELATSNPEGDVGGFVAVLGRDAARHRVQLLAGQAKAHLDVFGERAQTLTDAVDFVVAQRL